MRSADAPTKPGRLPAVPWAALLVVAGGILLLNLLLTVFLWYPEYEFHRIVVPSAETTVIFLLLFGLSFADRRKSRWALLPLSPLLFVVVLYSFGEGLKQHAFRRPFVPWTDLEFIPALFNMVFQTGAFDRTAILVGGGIAQAGPPLFDAIRKTVGNHAMSGTARVVPIVVAALGTRAGTAGAGALALWPELGSTC